MLRLYNFVSLNREVEDVAFIDLSPEAQASALLNNVNNVYEINHI